MKKITALKVSSLLVFATGALAPISSSGADSNSAVVLTVENRVEVARKGPQNWTRAQTNETIAIGDFIRTGLRSRATLRFADATTVRVNELTTIQVEPPAAAGQLPMMNQESGGSYFFNREQPTGVRFRTPQASGAIRGTEFNLVYDEATKATVVTLIDGEVELSNDQGSVTFKGGQQGTAEPGKKPTSAPLIDAKNIIQWTLYYPAVLDLDEIGLSDAEKDALSASATAYREGDLLGALSNYPDNRQLGTDAEKIYRAALLLAVGRVDQTEAALGSLNSSSPLGQALREVIAAVKGEQTAQRAVPTTGSEWVARSYYLQSRSQLDEARKAAREATLKSPKFGAAWVRLAEMEFGFGRDAEALAAVNKGLELAPRNAQGLALKGFLLAARNDLEGAATYFDKAVATDGALGNAWLGRGLTKIRRGNALGGRADLQTAATLEPNRSFFRSYLGKAFSYTWDNQHAEKELDLARKFDPNDPTPWLYTALVYQEENRLNEAVYDLKKSQELNQNRSIYRSPLLLDQDQSVRAANLASIYRDVGMTDLSAREASRAVSYDYGNYSAHLFLAESYDALRDPKQINLRYEAPWLSELLVAQLLAPPNAGNLSSSISQQEYSRFFDANHIGLFTRTDYDSGGNWAEAASQYGVFGNTGYAIDGFYRTDRGQRPNNDIRQRELGGRFKQQLTAQDSIWVQASYFDLNSGDVAQYYDQNRAGKDFRAKETQEPNVFVGYHREWSPGQHTLVLAGRIDDTLELEGSDPGALWLRTRASGTLGNLTTNQLLVNPTPTFSVDFERQIEAYTAELQHIWQTPFQTLVAGARYQTASADTTSTLARRRTLTSGAVTNDVFAQNVDPDLYRISVYAYESVRPFDWLTLSAGVTYDRLHYPLNADIPPVIGAEETTERVSPKFGVLWTPWKDTHVRAAYTRSLGGVFFDTSLRLEPTQVGGFNQAFRSLIPESVVGLVPGTRFENWGVGLDHSFTDLGAYLLAEYEWQRSKAERTIGVLANTNAPGNGFFGVNQQPNTTSTTSESSDYHDTSVILTYNQLIARDFAAGARYRITHAALEERFTALSATTAGPFNRNVEAWLHQINLFALYNHPSGIFGEFETIWSQQSNQRFTVNEPGDDFWQYNVYLGYRFLQRRGEVRFGVLNLSDRNYQLEPLTLYNELPRERTFAATLKFFF